MTNIHTDKGSTVKNRIEEIQTDIVQNRQDSLVIQPKESEVSNMLQIIAQCAKDPNVDIAKMIALRDMRDQELARLKEESFEADYVAMKDSLPRVIKSKNNKQTSSMYAPLEDINDVIDPILKKYGFATRTPVKSQNADGVIAEAILIHRSGHKDRCEVFMPIDNKGPQGTVNKTGPHATSSSIMYARRGALCALLNISTGDDTDGNNPNVIKQKSSFQENVTADAKKAVKTPNPPVKTVHEEKEPIWDKKTIRLLGDKNITLDFKSSQEAGEKLLTELAQYPTKKDRIYVVNLNMPIIRALIKKSEGDLITRIHKFADEGKL